MPQHKTDRLTCNKIGQALKEERRNQNLDRETLAEVLDVSDTTIKNVEIGVNTPSLGLLVNWSRALGVELHRIMRDAGV